MPSIRCQKCSLVNFSSQTHCQRCGSQLNIFVPVIEQRTYQQNFDRNNHQPSQSTEYSGQYETDQKTPLYCIRCGCNEKVTLHTFYKKYVSPVASLGIFLGILPYFVLRILLTTKHEITSPFCQNCWSKFKNIETQSALLVFGSFAVFILGLLIGGLYDSLLVFGICACLAILFFIYGRIYVAKVSPKFKKVNDKQVIIKAPIVGEIVYTK